LELQHPDFYTCPLCDFFHHGFSHLDLDNASPPCCLDSGNLDLHIGSYHDNYYTEGTETALEYRDERFNFETEDDMRRDAADECNRRELQFETDRDTNPIDL
jgi:hypothetical protein